MFFESRQAVNPAFTMVHACVSDIRFASVRDRFERLQVYKRPAHELHGSGIPSATAVADAAKARREKEEAAKAAKAKRIANAARAREARRIAAEAIRVYEARRATAAAAVSKARHHRFLKDLAVLLREYAAAPYHTVAGSVKVYMDRMSMSIGRVSLGNHWLKCIIRDGDKVVQTATIRDVEDVIDILAERKCASTKERSYVEVRDFMLFKTQFTLCISLMRPMDVPTEIVTAYEVAELVGRLYRIEEVLDSNGACTSAVDYVEQVMFPELSTMDENKRLPFLIRQRDDIKTEIRAFTDVPETVPVVAHDILHVVIAEVDAGIREFVESMM